MRGVHLSNRHCNNAHCISIPESSLEHKVSHQHNLDAGKPASERANASISDVICYTDLTQLHRAYLPSQP